MIEIRKILLVLSFSLILLNFASAQESEFGKDAKQTEQTVSQPLQPKFSPDISVSLGTTFSSFSPGYNSFGTFIAPEISFPVSNRFAVTAGIGYSSIFYNSPGESFINNRPSQYGSIYLSGSYKMTEKFTISGTGYKTFLLNPSKPPDENNIHTMDYSNQGIILNMDYKVSDKFRINASFQIHQQNDSPYNYMYPQQMGGFSPFNNHGFYPGF